MANTILHKRSSTPAGTPNTGDLSLGELAVNTYDGKLYMKTDDGIGGIAIVEVGGGQIGDLIVTSTPISDTLLSTKELFQISTNAQIAFDIEEVPGYGFDANSITYSANTASFAPVGGTDMGAAYIRPDGFAAYIIDTASNPGSINEYLLGTAWDLTSMGALNATYPMVNTDHADDMRGIWFNSTGTKAIVSGATQYAEYDFPTPFDVANASFVQFTGTLGNTNGVSALSFSVDGTKAYSIRRHSSLSQWYIKSLNVGTPWDISTMSLISDDDEITAETGGNQPFGVVVNQDGTKLFVIHDNDAETTGSSKVREYDLLTAYLASTMSLAASKVVTQSRYMRYMFWSPDGTDLFIMDNNATIYQYASSIVTTGGLTARLYHNSNERLASTSLGVSVTGSIAFTGAEAQVALPNFATLNLPSTPIDGGLVFDSDTSSMKYYNGSIWKESGATELSGLSDVGSAAITTGFVLVADGVDFKSRLLLEADIDDLGTYLTALADDTVPVLGGSLNVGGYLITGATAADANSNSGSVVIVTDDGGATDGTAGAITIQPGQSFATGAAGAVNINGSIGSNTGTIGGAINLTGGVAGPTAAGGDINLTGGAVGTDGSGGNITLTSGDGGSTSGDGGSVSIYAGTQTVGNGNGGNLRMYAGGAITGYNGGYINMYGGDSAGGANGGDIILKSGSGATTSYGGNFSILGGYASGATGGGAVTIQGGGCPSGAGGEVALLGGTGTSPGAVRIVGGSEVSIAGGAGTVGYDVLIHPGKGSGGTDGNIELHAPLADTGEAELRFWRDTDTGHTTGNYVALKASATLGADVTVTLPETDGVMNLKHIGIITESTTTRGLTLPDDNQLITCTHNAGAVTITIPAESSIDFPIGTQILIEQQGTSQVTVAITTDTLNSAGGLVSTASQYSTLTLIKTASTRWLLAGDLA